MTQSILGLAKMGRSVADVHLIEGDLLPRQFLHAAQRFCAAVAEVISGDHIIALLQKLQTGMGANISASAGNQYRHAQRSFFSDEDIILQPE